MRVLLACDGGGSLGVGHVIRSLALAEAAVAAGHEVVVAGEFEGSFLLEQLVAAPVDVVPLVRSLIDLIGRLRPDVLHVDSYGASDGLRDLVAPASAGAGAADVVGNHAMVFSNMEDGTFGRRPADVVVDPTLGAEVSPRRDDGSTWLLRGSRYTPVRQRVIDAGGRDLPVAQVAHSVLVVMGGTDPVGLAPVAVGLLARTGLALEVTVIAAGENAGENAERARLAAEGSRLTLDVLAPVENLAALMSAHDLVISAAGTSIWELCCIGVPAAVVWAVDNQREGYDRVVEAGVVIGLGGPDLGGDKGDERAVDLLRRVLTDSRARGDLVLAGRQVVDGLGAWRVVKTWELAQRQKTWEDRAPALVARLATRQDAEQLWKWRNDPVTRAGSRSSAEVPWDDHLRWVTDSLTRTDRVLLVVEDTVGSVGTVRWDLVGESTGETEGHRAGTHDWEVSITVAPRRRGESLARPLLRAAERALSEATRSTGTDVTAYLAVVQIDNRASVRMLEDSGYVPDLPSDPRGFMQYRKTARVP